MLRFRCGVNIVKGNRFNFITASSIISRQKAINSINKIIDNLSADDKLIEIATSKNKLTPSTTRIRFNCFFKKLIKNNFIFVLKKFNLFVFFSLLFSQQIPPNDPLYILFRQNFVETHDLSIFIKPYPYSFSDFQVRLNNTKDSDIFLRVSPSVNISNDILDLRSGTWLYGKWEKFSFLAEPLVVNDYYGEEIC